MDKLTAFGQRIKQVNTYYNAINDLPPTYKTGEACCFTQFIPDPVSK